MFKKIPEKTTLLGRFCCCEKMADDIVLNRDEEVVFIDACELKRCLWNPSDPSFRNRHARKDACKEIAIMLGKNWNEGNFFGGEGYLI